MQRTEDAVNAASLDALLAGTFYNSYTVAEAIERYAAHLHIVNTRVRNTIYVRLAAFLRTIDDLTIDIPILKREIVKEGVAAFTADVDALLRRPGALNSFEALADEPCVRAMFAAQHPRLKQSNVKSCLRARFMHLRLPDAIAQHAADTEANARADAPDHDMQRAVLDGSDLDNVLQALLKEGQPESNACYLFRCNVFGVSSFDDAPPPVTPAMRDKKVLLVPFFSRTGGKHRWDLGVLVRTGPDSADIHVFGPRRNHAQDVVDKMKKFARAILGKCFLHPTHMPLTRRVPASEHFGAYMAANLRAFLRACRLHETSGVLNVGWMHAFAPSRDYDDIAAIHAYARALPTQAAAPVEDDDAEVMEELPASASTASVLEEAGPSALKRTSNEAPAPKTLSKKAKKQ